MTAIVQPVASGGGAAANAQNVRGSTVGLAPGATQTLCSVVAGTRKIRGLVVFATADCEAWIEIDTVPMDGFRSRGNRVDKAYLVLPNPEPVSATALIALKVQNTGIVSGDYEGTLFAE